MDSLNAYVDESVHDDHGLYVIAAVLARPSLAPSAESALRAALPADRLPHWHGEDEPTRAKLAAVVAGLDVEARVYGCRYETSRRAEAARARALGWMLIDVDVPLDEIVLGQRHRRQDGKDRRFLGSQLRAGARTTYRHAPMQSEALLWVADIVAGAVCATWFRGTDHMSAVSGVLSHCDREE